MEALTSWKFPFSKESKPLQTLSPERVNASRPASTIISTTPTKTNDGDESQDPYLASPQSSPTRRTKANLFSDFHPSSGTPPKGANGFALPQSPSLPEINALRAHVRTNSDVQGLVKRFEHLDVRDRDAESKERWKRQEADLRRAQIAREEAESDVRRLREEVRRLEREGEVGRERERKVARRLEVVTDDFGALKESQMSQSSIYETELRKAKKEAFKSSSTILKLKEELKSTRNSLRVVQSDLDIEKQKVQHKEQERFEMEYQLIPLQEQVENLTQQLRTAQSEKAALKTSLQGDEVARIAAEGMIALPASHNVDMDLLASPQRRGASPLSDDKENMHIIPKNAPESRRLAEELEREKQKRQQAEELTEFLRMECLFKSCSCRSKNATHISHELSMCLDAELAAGMERVRMGMEEILKPGGGLLEQDEMEVERKIETEVVAEEAVEAKSELATEGSVLIHTLGSVMEKDLDRSITMTIEEPGLDASPDDQLREEAEKAFEANSVMPAAQEIATSTTETKLAIPSSPATPSLQSHQTTPFRNQPSIRTVTTTTTVPMHFTPVAKPHLFPKALDPEDVENQPPASLSNDGKAEVPLTPSFDRAAALAAIEYRRGRAKSIANGHATPRKQMLEGVQERRDISAPALGQGRAEVGVGGGRVTRSGSTGRKR